MGELILKAAEDSKFVLTGAVKDLLKNKRARMMMRTQFAYEDKGDCVEITTDQSIDKIAEILKLVAGYINAQLMFDEATSSEIADFMEREEEFGELSRNAKEIKDNHCDPVEFQDFTNVLHENMKSRHLYPLQLLSAYHLAFSQNACNFSVPGAGKTSIVYGAYTYLKYGNLKKEKQVDKLLIIGPLSSFGPWELEYEECFGVKPSCKRIGASMSLEERKDYFYSETAELNLISYSSAVSVKDEIIWFLKNNNVMVVLDEAHKIKNTSGGIQAATVMELARWCKSRVILTGTPAPNGYQDLYNLFHFIWPQNDVIKYNLGQLKDMTKTVDDYRVQHLMENINPFFIRIRKSDLGLPPVTEKKPILVQMKDSQRRIYDYIEQRFVDEVSKNKNEESFRSVLVRAKMMRLQQVATNPALLKEPLTAFSDQEGVDFSTVSPEDASIMRDIMQFYNESVPAKYEECLRLVREIIDRGEKVVIWAIFIKNIESLSQYLQKNNVDCRILSGATPLANETMSDELLEMTREGIVRDFHEEDCPFKVIIANPFAVAESISLHKVCHNAIYLERSFNCAHFIQSKNRIHRYGLKPGTETNYYYLLSEDSVDQTIDNRLREKEMRMLSIIENSPIPLFTNVTDEGDEDIKAILRDYVKRKTRASI